MPKPRVEEVTISEDGKWENVKREVKLDDEVKYAEYTRPTIGYLKQYMLDLAETAPEGEESELQRAYRLWSNSLDREATAKLYQSVQAESTQIVLAGVKRELMDIPVPKLIGAINGYIGQRNLKLGLMLPDGATPEQIKEAEEAVDKSIGFGPWRTAARKLVEGYERNGTKYAPAAKYNEAMGGLLEALPAAA